MGFLNALRKAIVGDEPVHIDPKVVSAWDLGEEPDLSPTEPEPEPDTAVVASQYDRAQWQKRVKRVLDGLPATEGEWPDLIADGKALSLSQDHLDKVMVDEFVLLVRRAVADRHVTEFEHRKLDLARILIGIPEEAAEATLNTVVKEAEIFFGKAVEGA